VVELIDEVYPKFDRQDYLDGKLQPVFFGSALNNFGVNYWIVLFKLLLHQDKDSETRLVEEKMSGFVLKSTPIWIQTQRPLAFIKLSLEL
jgi:peptide chain release factor 3